MVKMRWVSGLVWTAALGLVACAGEDMPRLEESPPRTSPPPLGAGDPPLNSAQRRALERWAAELVAQEETEICWRRTEVRGAGEVLSECPSGERDGALCYPTCRSGYDGVGPVCWQDCRSGYRDDGALCRKDVSIVEKQHYGRGAGYAEWDLAKCRREHGSCERYGAMYYPKCASGYEAVGCCVCRERRCPSGYTDDGAVCRRDAHIYAKHSYGRGWGAPMSCSSGLEQSGALCYPSCESDYTGVGPVCWGDCPRTQPVDCGAICGKSATQCSLAISAMVTAPLELAQNIVSAVVTGGGWNAVKSALKSALKSAAMQLGKIAVQQVLRESMVFRELSAKIERLIVRPISQELGAELVTVIADAASENILLATLLEDDDPELLDVLSEVDPTGVVAVIDAFYHPTCATDRLPDLSAYIDAKQPTNLARNKPAAQSSTARGGEARLATDTNLRGGAATTSSESNPWWRVDLQRSSWIGRIAVHRVGEGGVFPELRGLVLDERQRLLSSQRLPSSAGSIAEARFSVPGRYVKIEREGSGVLALAEVEVHEHDLRSTYELAGFLDLARGQPATQSSTAGDASSSAGNDGDPATVSLTEREHGAFWQVDLGAEERLENVVIDGSLADFDLVLLDQRAREVSRASIEGAHQGVADYKVRSAAAARFVRLELRGEGVLQLAEVSVHAIRPNWALAKSAEQPSNLSPATTASLAVDGDRSKVAAVTRLNEYRPYWQVDLGRERDLSRVRLFTGDTPLPAASVSILVERPVCEFVIGRFVCVPQAQEIVSAVTSGRDPMVSVAGRGRFVRVELNGPGQLRLAEVEIY